MFGNEESFGTIRNNTALKQKTLIWFVIDCFGTIRNNTALKLIMRNSYFPIRFGTIRNNTALKRDFALWKTAKSFGTIRNNTALKPRGPIFVTTFRNRAIHLS